MSSRLRNLHSLLVALVVLQIPLTASAFADAPQTNTDGTANPNTDGTQKETPKKAKQFNTVIVTGTHVTGRTEADSLSPIDVLSPKDLMATGSSDLGTALSSLLPSLDFPHPAINDGNTAIRPATLRGLSPDQVLVLVDGKRYHITPLINYNSGPGNGSSPVDLATIPISAIDHIEVLRDGASAQYGSDAIAGVINIVLKHGAGPGTNEITVNGGRTSKGDGAQNGAEGSYGYAFGAPGADGRQPGWVRLSLNYQNSMTTNRAYNTDIATTVPGASPAWPYQHYGEPAVVAYQGLLNFGYKFSPSVEAYGYLDASRRNVTSNGIYRSWDGSSNVQSVYPNGYLPQIINHANDINSVIGLRGETEGQWSWDASLNYGRSNLVFDINNSLNVNEYYSLGYSPTYFYAGSYGYTQEVADYSMSKGFKLDFLPYILTFAWGAEFRREQYTINPGELSSYYYDPNAVGPDGSTPSGGSQVWPGIEPVSAGSWSRHNSALYGDLETDLTDRLSVGLAARYEDYSDAGSALAGKISALYHLTDTLALRGTISNGFRAPSLPQEYYTSISSIVYNRQIELGGTYPATSAIARSMGAKPLVPEKSVSYSLGLTWNPDDNFTSTLDVYQIRIGDRILYSGTIPLNDPNSNISSLSYFFNGGTTRTRGVDWTNAYGFDMGNYGRVKLTASANWNTTTFLSINAPYYVSDGQVVTTFGRDAQGQFTDGTPRNKFIFSGDWQYGGFGFHANVTRYGSVSDLLDVDQIGPGNADQTFAPRWLLDVSASYRWNAWTFTVGADNLTNVYPTKNAASNPNELGFLGIPYSPISPFGFSGRYVYGKINYQF
ncbi:TonB-dependent receptor plug domain-containing protein [Rhodanobacter sp. Si-c]|uniref:TonB-dependent receptor plug domain-containing protein n=1 Tax=Rhodanobacter lycopersici TaxID=3162487 RepID=A0ABV3QIM8_9GAMM